MVRTRTGQATMQPVAAFRRLDASPSAATPTPWKRSSPSKARAASPMRRAAIGSTGLLPRWLWPYAQLARWDRPIGWWLLLWPCWWSAALAASAMRGPAIRCLAAAGTLAPAAVPGRRHRHARRRLHLQRHRRRGHRRAGRAHALAAAAVGPGRRAGRRWSSWSLQALVGLVVLLQFNRFAILLGIVSLADRRHLSVHEARHRLAATRARPCLFLGRADGLGGGVRQSRPAAHACSMSARSCG